MPGWVRLGGWLGVAGAGDLAAGSPRGGDAGCGLPVSL